MTKNDEQKITMDKKTDGQKRWVINIEECV